MNKKILKKRPIIGDFDQKPYAYIEAMTQYADSLEEAIENILDESKEPKESRWKCFCEFLKDMSKSAAASLSLETQSHKNRRRG